MAKKREPGQKMVLCITFIDKKDKTPVKDQMVLLYQTAEDGNYHPKYASDESTARIHVIGVTDDKGRLFVETILPGSYATSGDNRHIHTKVFGAKPEAYDLHFKQYTNARMKRFIESKDQFFLEPRTMEIDPRTLRQILYGNTTMHPPSHQKSWM